MAQAANRMAQEFEDRGSRDLVRRLMARPLTARGGAARSPLAFEEADDDEFSRQEAELLVVKAALKSERREVEELRSQLAELTASAIPAAEIRADRDRWAGLVERLLFSGR